MRKQRNQDDYSSLYDIKNLLGKIIHHAFFVGMYQVNFKSFTRVENSITFFAGWHEQFQDHFDLMGLIESKLSLDQNFFYHIENTQYTQKSLERTTNKDAISPIEPSLSIRQDIIRVCTIVWHKTCALDFRAIKQISCMQVSKEPAICGRMVL